MERAEKERGLGAGLSGCGGGEGMKVQGFGGCEDELKTMVILGLSDCGKSGRSCRRDFVRWWSRFRAGGFMALWSVSEV